MLAERTQIRETTGDAYEIARRADAFSQARRIEEYLPVLYAQVDALEAELAETREFVADEEQALKDLTLEGKCATSVIRNRYRAQGRASPV